MTAKRFTWNSKDVMIDDTVTGNQLEVIDITEIDVLLEVLNDLHEENQRLKQYTKQVLQNHLDAWRGVYNPIDESIIVEICVVKSIAEDLGVDLE